LTSAITTVADATANTLGDVADTVTHVVGGLIGDATPLVSDLTSTVTTVADTTVHMLGDTVGDVIGDASHTLTGLTDSVTHSVSASANLDTLMSPVTGLLDHDGSVGSAIPSAADSTNGLHDLLGSTLDSLGVSSSGSLSFAAETPDTIASRDAGANTSGYSQFNLAISDASHDIGATAPASTDTGGITTIVANAIGIGPHATDSTSASADHDGDQATMHLPLVDDLHSHLHLGLFG
jgi:hypothetical protein